MKKSKQKGASLLEFGLMSPLIFLVMFAIIEYSVMFAAMILMNSTAADAARQASIFQSGFTADDYRIDALDFMADDLPAFVNGFANRVQMAGALENCGGQTCLRLTVTYPDYGANPLMPGYISALGLLPNNLTSESYTRLTVTPVGL